MTNEIQSGDDRREAFNGRWRGRMCAHTDSDGNPNFFYVNRNDTKPVLNANYVNPENQFNLENELVLARRKLLHFSPGR